MRKDRIVRLKDLLMRTEDDKPELIYVPVKEKRPEDRFLPAIRAA